MAGTPDLGHRFEPIRRLGAGGMGEVWLVEDRESGRCVVAKIAQTATGDTRQWLRREYELGRRLDHPNIVQVNDFFDAGPSPFMTMEYLAGGHIGRMVGRPLEELLPVLIQVSEALRFAHDRGIVHRDLKASNVLLDEAGRPHVADFGIADLTGPEAERPLIGGGSRFSISPQQLDGRLAAPTDDLYAFGALVHLLISGAPPLGDHPSDHAIRSAPPQPLHAAWPVPPELQALVDDLLAKEPEKRPENMDEVTGVLSRLEARATDRTLPPRWAGSSAPVKLTPPPRPDAIRPIAPSTPDGQRDRPRAARGRRIGLATVGLFASLGGLLVLVFVFLPRWVENRPPISPAKQPPPSAAADPMTEPPTASRQPMDPPPIAEDAGSRYAGQALDLMDRGARAERSGDLAAAAHAYSTAARLDPQSPEARAAVARVAAKTESNAFAAVMSEALAALDGGDPAAAQAALERARIMRPSSPEVDEAMRRVAAAQRRQTLAALQRRAETAESSEAWREAVDLYTQVLDLDGNLAFAIAGRERSVARQRIGERIEYHLANPDRLVSDEVLAETAALLAQAESTRPRGAILNGQTTRLTRLVETASIPVPVSLHSDNLTRVVIHKVGPLGTFSRMTVDLRPGTYTLQGSRPGYRDVRLEVTVRPGGPVPPVVIQCEEEV